MRHLVAAFNGHRKLLLAGTFLRTVIYLFFFNFFCLINCALSSVAASAFLLSQKCTRILVGDPHQQIYSFRGARNALQEVESSNTFYLTQVSGLCV